MQPQDLVLLLKGDKDPVEGWNRKFLKSVIKTPTAGEAFNSSLCDGKTESEGQVPEHGGESVYPAATHHHQPGAYLWVVGQGADKQDFSQDAKQVCCRGGYTSWRD